MLIVQFPIIIFGPLFKQVKYWDKKKQQQQSDWLYMRNFSNHDTIMDSNMMEDMMEWWKLDKLRQHTDLWMSERLKSKQKKYELLGVTTCANKWLNKFISGPSKQIPTRSSTHIQDRLFLNEL